MRDDMNGLYKTTSEASGMGKAIGMDEAFRQAKQAISLLSVEAESAGQDERFKAMEDAQAAISVLQIEHNRIAFPLDAARFASTTTSAEG